MTNLKETKINTELIRQRLTTAFCGRELVCFDELESTNLTAKELAKAGCPAGTTVLCENQTAGRGRRDRQWLSSPSENICMSIVLRPSVEPQLCPRFTVAAAVGVYRAVLRCCQSGLGIKWPNDIMLNNKKLCGILLDCAATLGGVSYLIAGIGVNVNTPEFPKELQATATSILRETGARVSRERVIADILNETEPLFRMCETDAGFRELLRYYSEASSVLNRQVSIIGTDGTHEGMAVGFDQIGRIILRLNNGTERVFDSGDVSLRYEGMYGS